VVEADPVLRRTCLGALEAAGFVVASVESGIAAVAAARHRPPDLIVIDSQLPDVPWRVAIHWLRSNPGLRSVPVVVLTPRALDGGDILAAQPVAAVRKPISEESIREGLATLLG
jgi:CheY-like chemotaxis protein